MASTVADFWCMIWEQDVATIVMLTNLEENGKVRRLELYLTLINYAVIFSQNVKSIGPTHLIAVKIL